MSALCTVVVTRTWTTGEVDTETHNNVWGGTAAEGRKLRLERLRKARADVKLDRDALVVRGPRTVVGNDEWDTVERITFTDLPDGAA
ncbi:hypothetical protein [Nocardioides speluncae]|uniref:hypothetical protein n=1 Tax=Nocardioides speluncae TaxID=2670337 RepID=UPI000D69B9B8|nr:hypothetical protein [Nocardioides speluncae]